MATRNRILTKLAKDIDASGNIKATGISADVSLGLDVYDSFSLLPMVGNTEGDQAFVISTGRLYVHSGSGWYNTALINRTPTVASIEDSDGNTTPFILATDGTATRITITAADSDGDPLTYNAIADSDFTGLATLSQESNVFTVTPLSQDSATTTSGTIAFTITDGINTATPAAQTFTLTFLSPLWKDVSLSIGTSSTNGLDNSTFIDRSTNAHTVTPTGSPVQTAFHPYLENWSVDFDGTGDYLSITDNGSFDFGTGDFTIETWIYATSSLTSSNLTIIDARPASGSTTGNYYFFISTTGKLRLVHALGASDTVYESTSALSPNQWYHVAASRSGSDLRLFIDGIVENTTSVSGKSFDATLFNIGYKSYTTSSLTYWPGYFSNMRLVKGAALYTSNFTPPTEKLTAVIGTSLLTCQSNRFIDNSSNAHAITVNGDPKISAFNLFGQESEYAVGENKGSVLINLNRLSTPVVVPATDDFTIECWIYPTNVTAGLNGTQGIFGQYVNGSSGAFLFYMINGVLRGFSASDTILSNITFKNNTWYHIALVRSSTTDTVYIDGIAVDSGYLGSILQTNALIGFFVVESRDYYFRGNIADLKVSNTALYTSAFTPPTAPVGNTNASLYLPFDNAGIFDKTGNHTLILAGDASTSTAQTKFADTAMYFDGTGDFIEIPYSELNPNSELFQTDTYTLETWVLQTTAQTGSGGAIFDTRFNTVNGAQLRVNTNGTLIYYYTQGASITTTATLSNNFWHHIAVVNNAGTCTLYLDGLSAGTVSMGTARGSTAPLRIGGDNNTVNYAGYIENFQILKGVAKYTSNFTVPDRTQGRTYQVED